MSVIPHGNRPIAALSADELADRRAYKRQWMERRRRARGVNPRVVQLRLALGRPARLSDGESAQRRKARYARLRLELIEYQQAWNVANTDRIRPSRRLHRRKRDAWKRAGRQGDVSFRRVLERDGWRCGICEQAIWPEALSEVHFDHIVPLSKGGLHIESNIQVAHVTCNLRKAARIE